MHRRKVPAAEAGAAPTTATTRDISNPRAIEKATDLLRAKADMRLLVNDGARNPGARGERTVKGY
ncbi:hypothetical protein Nans01_19530 [Nocardiopsis ansamitocini]|uniref:Uncharacterized protein n=1 Tax=Nocardiopsis ansamitocini TaxID=1670832 RepID=A0A9W6P5U8_9ACTN|nr:hypothetical protein Nans01_19530 [Nocardiopsis ansamitocini]